MRIHFLVSVSGRVVSKNFLPVLLAVSITKGTDKTADTARFDLDDGAGSIRFPKTGERVHVELGIQGGAVRTFDGEVDTASWSLNRAGGSVLSVTARSVSLQGKEKAPRERHWESKPLNTILDDAGREAGIAMQVHSAFAGVVPEYEAQDGESFLAFGERLAREHGAIFRIAGKRGVFVPYNSSASGGALSTITVSRGLNLISASGFEPTTDRPRIREQVHTFYDLDEARRLSERYSTGDTVDAGDTKAFSAPDKSTASRRAKADGERANRDKASGTVVINGAPSAQPGGKAILTNVRPGVDGTYTISSVTDELSRAAGYTTSLSLGEPQGSAGADDR